MSEKANLSLGVVILILAVATVVILTGWVMPVGGAGVPMRLWIAGAGALGLVSGLTSGLSKQPGSGTEFVKFIGAGILVPILGGVAALLAKTQEVAEKSTYSGTQLVEKTTRTVTFLSDGSMHPLAVPGAFFVAFALLAVLGIIAGALLRKSGFIEVMTG